MTESHMVSYETSKDADKLYSLMESELSNSRVILDLVNAKFIKPNEVILFVMFLIRMGNLGNKLNVLFPEEKKTHEYLEAIGLINFCNKNLTESSTLNAITSQTAMPIRRLTEERMSEYIDFAKSYFEGICHGKDLTMLNICMAELLNNVYNHSESEIDAYAFCQYFGSKKEIQVVVGDYGIGIPYSVNRYLKTTNQIEDKLNDLDALRWALVLNNSAKSIPNNQGKGLDNVLTFTKANGGNLFIYTNGAFLRTSEKDNELVFDNNYIHSFKGTIVVFTINVDNLDDLDDELSDFDF